MDGSPHLEGTKDVVVFLNFHNYHWKGDHHLHFVDPENEPGGRVGVQSQWLSPDLNLG